MRPIAQNVICGSPRTNVAVGLMRSPTTPDRYVQRFWHWRRALGKITFANRPRFLSMCLGEAFICSVRFF